MNDFTAYLQSKDLSQATQKLYNYNLNRFIKWFKNDPISCQKKDVLNYLDYLQNKLNLQSISRKTHLLALNYYFNFLGLKEVTSLIKLQGTKKKRLQYIFSNEELIQLQDDYYQSLIQNYEQNINHTEHHSRIILKSRQRNYVMLSFLVYQGLATTELDLLHLSNIDFLKANIKIERKGKQRILQLQASQIGTLMNYIQQIRPQFLEDKEETEKLFLPLSERAFAGSKSNLSVRGVVRTLVTELKKLHPKLTKLTQLRTSVITHWIKAEGLRKAQYFAGHKSIISTEEYLHNNLEELTDDLVKFNPF